MAGREYLVVREAHERISLELAQELQPEVEILAGEAQAILRAGFLGRGIAVTTLKRAISPYRHKPKHSETLGGSTDIHYSFMKRRVLMVAEAIAQGYQLGPPPLNARHASTALPTLPSCARTTSSMTSRSRFGNMLWSVLRGVSQGVQAIPCSLCIGLTRQQPYTPSP